MYPAERRSCDHRAASILFFLSLSLLIFSGSIAFAQNSSLSGIVADPSGAVVPGAVITLTDVSKGSSQQTKTNRAGFYSLPFVPPGNYSMTVEATGFKRLERTDISVETARVLALNVHLQLGETSELITVNGSNGMANTTNDSPAVALTVPREFVENVPLNGRSFQDLIQLTPGTVSSENGYYSINGQRTNSNNYMVDGVSVNLGGVNNNSSTTNSTGAGLAGAAPSQTVLGTTQSIASIDALQEFTIQTSGYTAEYGRNPGGQVQFTTRSGTSKIHGTLFDYLRNTVFDANGWANNYYGQPKSPEHQNDFGGTISGPLIIPKLYNGKEKSFYFFSYEGIRLLLPEFESEYVPTQAFRDWAYPGVRPFIEVAPLPSAGSPGNGDGCTIPDPVTGRQTACDARFNYAYSNSNNLDNIGLRIDQTFGKHVHAFVRYADTPSSAKSGAEFINTSTTNVHTWTAGLTATLSNNVLDEFRFNYSHDGERGESSQNPIEGAVAFPRNLLIPAAYDGPNSNGEADICCMGSIGVYTAIGLYSASVQHQYQLVDTLSWTHGRHGLKVGVDWRRLTPTYTPTPFASFVGFQSRDAIQNGTATWMSVVASAPGKPVLDNLSLFAQDHWKINSRFSLDYGLRWEFNPPPGPSNGTYPVAIASSDLSTATLAPTGTQPFKTNYHSFAPRLGFAWNVLPSQRHAVTLRAGFGIFFDTGQTVAAGVYGGDIYGGYGGGYPFNNTSGATSIPYSQIAGLLVPPSLNVTPTPPYSGFSLTDPNLTIPYTEQWNLSIDQQLNPRNTLTVSYVGNNGKKLTFMQYFESIGNFEGLYYTNNGSQSSYHSVQVQDTGRITDNLDIVGSFTYAHALDNASGDFVGQPPVWGNSDYDLRRVLNLALNYHSPTVKGERWSQKLTHGWLLANRFSTQSGYPLNVVQGYASLSSRSYGPIHPDLVPGVPIYLHGRAADFGGKPVPASWRLNPAAFAAVPEDADGNPTRLGTLGRNFLRNPSFYALNTALQRSFPIYENLRIDFRAEAFNIFNHPNLSGPDTSIANTTFGQLVNGTITTIGSSNALYSMGAARSLQFSLHLQF